MSDMHSYPLVIFPEAYDERAEYETLAKGWLSQVIVQSEDGSRYSVSFIDPVRLQQDMEEYARLGTPYFTEPGLIVLSEVTAESIRKAIRELWGQGYFNHLKPLTAAAGTAVRDGTSARGSA